MLHRRRSTAVVLALLGAVLILLPPSSSSAAAAPDPPPVDLSTDTGSWNDPLTASVTGSCGGFVIFSWVGRDEEWPDAEEVVGGWTATTTVPSSLPLGSAWVSARCSSIETPSISWPATEFVVVLPPMVEPPPVVVPPPIVEPPTVVEPPPVALDPTSGGPGDPVTATMTGACDGIVTVDWVDEAPTWSEPPVPAGDGFRAATTVPWSFPPGPHAVEARCDGVDIDDFSWPSSTFELSVPPVALDPVRGRPGDAVTARVTGGCDGEVTFSWAGRTETWADPEREATGFVATTTIPRTWGSGTYDVAARCDGTVDFTWPPAGLEVGAVVVDTPEALRLSPDAGPPGTEVRAEATGYEECGQVLLRWEDEATGAPAVVDARGTAALTLAVPGDVPVPSTSTLVASCPAGEVSSAAFTVTAAPASEERLSLSADLAAPGATVTARASGFECDLVRLRWQGRGWAGRAVVGATGVASATVTVPRDADAGEPVRLVARCDPPDLQSASAGLRVERASPASQWWIPPAVLLLLLLLAAPVAHAIRLGRDRAWVRSRVRVGAGPRPAWRTTDEPATPSRPDVGVRIVPRSDRGDQRIEEVDR